MMGHNVETYGGHSPADVAISYAYKTNAERTRGNLLHTWQRLMDMGPGGAVQLYAAKLFKAYGSGTLAWNGSFLMNEVPKRSDAASVFLRNIYYDKGAYHAAYETVMQGLWLLLLVLCTVALFARRRQPEVQVLGITLLGLTLYQMLFEAWPRYLVLYLPFYVMLAAMGLRAACGWVRGQRTAGNAER